MAYYEDLFTVFPAHAGVILTAAQNDFESAGVPRTRGGDPDSRLRRDRVTGCSPHTRG